MADVTDIDADSVNSLLLKQESFFFDVKSKDVAPSKLSRSISAFANAGGGELIIGIEEFEGESGAEMQWLGFNDFEDANSFFQVIEQIDPMSNIVSSSFLRSNGLPGVLLHLTVAKSQDALASTDGKFYIRRNAQNLPLNEAGLERLKYDKGIKSFEDQIADALAEEITNSERVIEFLLDVIPSGEPAEWLQKQKVLVGDRPTVAGILLFSDGPQATLPKRSAVKILRYQTKAEAERDFLAFDPVTVEGAIYDLIYESVDKVKEIIDGIEKMGPKGLEKISYPQDALHEILTNAVLHRDYSIAADVQIRIFDNRLEIESPGRLPGHVTIGNIAKTQFARNPKLVRLVNKFKNPPQ